MWIIYRVELNARLVLSPTPFVLLQFKIMRPFDSTANVD